MVKVVNKTFFFF